MQLISGQSQETQMKDIDRQFEMLYAAYADEIYAYLFAHSGMEQQTAEDLTQETFLAVYRGLQGFRWHASVRTWLYRIAKNKLSDFLRIRYRKAVKTASLDAADAAVCFDDRQDVEALILRAAESRIVIACMESLPEHYRLTLTLKYVDGLSVKRIAAIAQKNEKSVENLLRRARTAFAKQYLAISKERSDDEKR